MSGGGACGKRWGYAEVSVGTGAKLGETMRKWARGMELLLPGTGCPGDEDINTIVTPTTPTATCWGT